MATELTTQAAIQERTAIRREHGLYTTRKPGKVPPADSPTRPALARLWRAAHVATTKRPKARTFTHAGRRFGVVYAGDRLYVTDWQTRALLVRHPASLLTLQEIIEPWVQP